MSDKGLIFRMFKELLQHNDEINNFLTYGKRLEKTLQLFQAYIEIPLTTTRLTKIKETENNKCWREGRTSGTFLMRV